VGSPWRKPHGILGVHGTVLRRWVREGTADPQQAFPGQGQMKPDQLEIERLRREVTKLKAERDILKKAAAYFAKESLCSAASS
jgi:transposase